MKGNESLISQDLIFQLNNALNCQLHTIGAYSGSIDLKNSELSLEVNVSFILRLSRTNELIHLVFDIQGDDLFIRDTPYIGLKIKPLSTNVINWADFKFQCHLVGNDFVQNISVWNFSSKDFSKNNLINLIVLSLKDNKNVFIQLGSTCDAFVYFREQSIEDYFKEKNKFYDDEYVAIRLLTI